MVIDDGYHQGRIVQTFLAGWLGRPVRCPCRKIPSLGALCGCLTWREAHALVLGMARIGLILYGALFTGRNVEHFFLQHFYVPCIRCSCIVTRKSVMRYVNSMPYMVLCRLRQSRLRQLL